MGMTIAKRIAVMLLALCLGLTAAACGEKDDASDAGNTGAGAGGGKAPVKLRIMWWGSQFRHDVTLKALDLYTQKNPNVTFEPEYQGFDGYQDKISTMSAAKNTPDIFQMDAAWLNDWASTNRLLDLSVGINVNDIDSALLETGKYKGKLYGLPLGNNAWGMVYNKTVFDKLGVQPPKTWDELFQMAKDLKSKLAKDQYLIKDMTSDSSFYASYQLSKGKGFPQTADGKFNYDKDTWLEWMNRWAELRKGGFVTPPDVTVSDKNFDVQLDLLGQEKILIKGSHAAEFGGFDALKPGSFALAPIPRGEKASGWLKASMYWSISPESNYKDEAKKFLDWFVNDPEAADILGTSRGTPVSKKVLASLEPKFNAVDKMGVDLINKVAADGNVFDPGPGNKGGWAKFNKEYANIVQQIMFDKISPDKAWEEVVALSKDLDR